MLRTRGNKNILAVIMILSLWLSTGCASYKNTTYFRDIPDSLKTGETYIQLAKYSDLKIQPGDLLYVTVQTLDPNANSITGTNTTGNFSIQAVSSMNGATTSAPAYLVNKQGNIELPLVGNIRVGGLSTTEAREAIRKKAAVYYKDPVVNVRFANLSITVLGEVNRPAQYTVPTERVTLLDAIGMAGDLTIYGKRENVLLIREENGQKKAVRFNLNSTDMMASPYFYLKQNDVIYVEPNKSKAAANDVRTVRNISIITSLASLLIVAISRVQF